MSLFKLTITLAPVATGSAAAALFALHELDARTKLILKVVVTLGAIATFLGIIIEGSEIVDWIFDSQTKVSAFMAWFDSLGIETRRGIIAGILTAVLCLAIYMWFTYPISRSVMLGMLSIGIIGVITYSITAHISAVEAEKYAKQGFDFYRKGEWESASAAFAKANQLHPTEEIHEYRAACLKFMGRNDEAVREYSDAIKIRPTADLYVQKAELEDPAAAVLDYTAAIELSPDEEMYLHRSFALEKLGRLNEAIADESFIINKWPGSCHHWWRGNLYWKLGEKTKAENDFEQEAKEYRDQICGEDAQNAVDTYKMRHGLYDWAK